MDKKVINKMVGTNFWQCKSSSLLVWESNLFHKLLLQNMEPCKNKEPITLVQKIKGTNFDMGFFQSGWNARYFGSLSGETGVPAWLRPVYCCDLLNFHLATHNYLVFLPD